MFVLSDGLNVNGSDLARGLASGVSEGVSITGGLSGDSANFAETWVVADDGAGPQRVAAVGLYGDDLRIGYGSDGRLGAVRAGAHHHPRRGQRPL